MAERLSGGQLGEIAALVLAGECPKLGACLSGDLAGVHLFLIVVGLFPPPKKKVLTFSHQLEDGLS